MKGYLALITLLFASIVQAQTPAPTSPRPSVWDATHWFYVHPDEPAHSASEGVSHHILRSSKMQRDVGFNILVPPGYETGSRSYPVIYNLHGARGHEGCKGFAPKIMALMKAGKVAPAIWVFPNGAQGSMWRDGPEGNKFATYVDTFIIKELIPHVDKTWRTLPQREHRAVTGFSMGGYGSVRFAFRYPDLFSACFSIAGGAFQPKEALPKEDPEKAKQPDDYFPTLLLPKNRDQLQGRLSLKLLVGTADFNFKPVKEFAAFLEKEQLPFEQEYPEGLTHKDLDRYFSTEAITWLHQKVSPKTP
jgi:enterochelin esterase-like enzyme